MPRINILMRLSTQMIQINRIWFFFGYRSNLNELVLFLTPRWCGKCARYSNKNSTASSLKKRFALDVLSETTSMSLNLLPLLGSECIKDSRWWSRIKKYQRHACSLRTHAKKKYATNVLDIVFHAGQTFALSRSASTPLSVHVNTQKWVQLRRVLSAFLSILKENYNFPAKLRKIESAIIAQRKTLTFFFPQHFSWREKICFQLFDDCEKEKRFFRARIFFSPSQLKKEQIFLREKKNLQFSV